MSDTHDPFKRGPYTVGVRATECTDRVRHRILSVELYYPAIHAAAGRDLDPMTQATFLPPGGFTGTTLKRQAAVDGAEELPGDWPLILDRKSVV